MDFDTSKLFGSETQTLATMAKRGLVANNVNQVTAYIRLKHIADRSQCFRTGENPHSFG